MEKIIQLLDELKQAIQEIPTASYDAANKIDLEAVAVFVSEQISYQRIAEHLDEETIADRISYQRIAERLDEETIADYVSNVIEIDTKDIAEEIDVEDVAAQLSTFINYKKLAKELIAELKEGNDEK